MSLTALQGMTQMVYPFDLRMLRATTFQSLTIDATGEKVALGGRVWFKERTGTKDISRVWFRFGSVTKAGGSGLTVSLQDMSLVGPSADSPKPDETQDQTVAIANGNSSFASNTTIRTGTLSADRTVAYGEKLCVVIEFDGSGRLSSDSVAISMRESGTEDRIWTPWATLKSGGSWAVSQHWPIVALEFDDGSFGTLEGVWMTDGSGTHEYIGTDSPDEYGVFFTVPWQCKVDALVGAVGPTGTEGDFYLTLYSGTSVVAQTFVDGDTISVDHGLIEITLDGEYTLNANQSYIVALRAATDGGEVGLRYESIADADLVQLWGDDSIGQVSRTNEGSWGAIDQTKIPLLGVRISGFHDDDLP